MSEPGELFLENLPLIDRTIKLVCRKSGLSSDEIEDFAQFAKLRLIENDYEKIRAYQERSSFGTFIAAVVMRILLDHRNHEWGKWRRSAEAERLGDVAIQVERLLYRDGYTLAEAFQVLAPRCPGLTHEDLAALASQIPARTRRRMVDIEEASGAAAARAPDVDCTEIAARVSTVVQGAIGRIPEDDQLILQLRFEADMTVAQIARALDRNQQQLYRRLYALFDVLKEELESAGITAADVAYLIGSDTGFLDFKLKKNRDSRPSELDGSTVADREDDS